MLKQTTPSRLRLATGIAIAFSLSAAAGLAAATGQAGAVAAGDPAVEQSYHRVSPPTYPPQALANKESGDVVLRVLVDRDGRPRTIEVERSSDSTLLDGAAVEAVEQWVFNPGVRDGKPVEGWVLVPISFRLDAEDEAATPPEGALDTIHLTAPQQRG